MVAQVKSVLKVEPTEADCKGLERALRSINEEKFDGQLKISARWEIPSAVEPCDIDKELCNLPESDQLQIIAATQAYAERNFQLAHDLIKPMCKYEMRSIIGLYTSVLRHIKDEVWFHTSQKLWISDADLIKPAVASIELRDGVEQILVHPALSSIGLKAPRYVLNYVLFHEALHKVLETTSFNPHPPLFRKFERRIEKREEAVAWLIKHRFATIEDTIV